MNQSLAIQHSMINKLTHGINAKTIGGPSQLSKIARLITCNYSPIAQVAHVLIALFKLIMTILILEDLVVVALEHLIAMFTPQTLTNGDHGTPLVVIRKNSAATFIKIC